MKNKNITHTKSLSKKKFKWGNILLVAPLLAVGVNFNGNIANAQSNLPSFCQYTQISASAAGGHSLGLRDDGTVWEWGYTQVQSGTGIPTQVSGFSGVTITAVAAGFNHGLALDSNGNVWAWGVNPYGQLGTGSTGDLFTYVSPTQVVGTDYATNSNSKLTGIIAIAAGNNDSYALKSDGTVYSWGDGSDGELGNGTTGFNTYSDIPVQVKGVGGSGFLTGVTSIAAGSFHALANAGGTALYAWGYNSAGQLGNGTDGGGTSSADSDVPVAVSGLPVGITSIAGGNLHSLAIANGTAFAWGDNTYGQLGDGTTTERDAPVEVSGLLAGVTSVSGGVRHSLAIANGTLYAWGEDQTGALGDGSTANESTPVTPSIPNGLTVSSIAAGSQYSLALDNNGNLLSWGSDDLGQLGNGSTNNSPVLTPIQTLAPCIIPNHGLTSGGDIINITGHNFQSGATVTFGGTDATNVTVNTSTSLTATTGAHTSGLVDVVITNPTGSGDRATQTNGFLYTPLTVTTINPSSGPTTGGTSVTISGTDFLQGATVTIGGASATINSVSSDGTTISAITPPGTAGAADVVITNPSPDNQTQTLTGGFTYIASCSTGTVGGGYGGGGHGLGFSPSFGMADILLAQIKYGGGLGGSSIADKGCSTISATTPVVADGTSTSNITVTLNDQYSNPVSGEFVKVNPSGAGPVSGTTPADCTTFLPLGPTGAPIGAAQTGSDGKACFTATATIPGNETFTAFVVGGNGLTIGSITQQATVTFTSASGCTSFGPNNQCLTVPINCNGNTPATSFTVPANVTFNPATAGATSDIFDQAVTGGSASSGAVPSLNLLQVTVGNSGGSASCPATNAGFVITAASTDLTSGSNSISAGGIRMVTTSNVTGASQLSPALTADGSVLYSDASTPGNLHDLLAPLSVSTSADLTSAGNYVSPVTDNSFANGQQLTVLQTCTGHGVSTSPYTTDIAVGVGLITHVPSTTPIGSYTGTVTFTEIPIDCSPVSGVTLAQTIGTGDTSFNVSSASGLSTSQVILIDAEKMQITAINGTLITVSRAVDGTIASAHNSGTAVYSVQ